MKVLFFLEPFPVRGQPTDFQWIWERWERLAPELEARDFDCVFACSDAVRALNRATQLRVFAPSDLGLPRERQCADDSQWIALMSEAWHPEWRPFVERLFDATEPDAIVSWTVNRPLQAAAAARNVPILHMELGAVRLPWGNFYYADPAGLNGTSSVPSIWPALRDIPLNPIQERQLDALVNAFVRDRTDLDRSADLRHKLGLSPTKPVIGVFLQLPRDSNILMWSRVPDTAALMTQIQRRFPTHLFQYVIKTHPGDPRPSGLAAFEQWFVAEPVAQHVIDICDAVCTINSSVGVEALAAEKPLYTFGASPYEVLGCTRDAFAEPPGPCAPLSVHEREHGRRLLHFLLQCYFLWEDDVDDPDIFGALLERLVDWRKRKGSLLEWFIERPYGVRLNRIRARKRWIDERHQREHCSLELTAAQSEVATLSARFQATEENAAATAAKSERLEAELMQSREQVSALTRSLPIRLGNVVRRIPALVSIVRRVRRYGRPHRGDDEANTLV
ncbi:MAG: hypothetical protein H7Z43_00055 [Clostridia bacterium]|nr:hypothetical protein [Deltaproteobacteria bacterium]